MRRSAPVIFAVIYSSVLEDVVAPVNRCLRVWEGLREDVRVNACVPVFTYCVFGQKCCEIARVNEKLSAFLFVFKRASFFVCGSLCA